MTTLRGSCLCGEVRFEIDGPLMRSSHYHCRQCQKAHGAPFRTRARVAAADFRFLAGEELVSFYELTPGTHRGAARHLGEASARASPAGPTFFTAAVARRPAARKGRSGGNGARSKPAAG